MNYNEFKRKVQGMPIIYSRDLTLHQSNKQVIRNQLKRWHTKKLLIRLKRGLFILNETDRKVHPSRTYLANQLYNPSYLSMEYALKFYGLIPEAVRDLTSVTTRKTSRIVNELGIFNYQHIKRVAFRGFKMLKDEAGLMFFIAEPEKAIIDFCYLNLRRFSGDYAAVFKESYRLQNLDTLKVKKIMQFTELFNSEKLIQVAKVLCAVINKERGKR